MSDITTPIQSIEFRSIKAPNMNPITTFLVFLCIVAGAATWYWVNPYLPFVFLAAAVLIVLSL